MIWEEDGLFTLKTENTQYLFMKGSAGHLEHLYYGKNYAHPSKEALHQKNEFLVGNGVAYSTEEKSLNLENLSQEISTLGKGDIREPFLSVTTKNGAQTRDFLYESHNIFAGKAEYSGLPSSCGNEEEVQTLVVTLVDKNSELQLLLKYHVYEKRDVITRSAELINNEKEPVRINRFMSNQLDLPEGEYSLTTFTGAWAREMEKKSQSITAGKIINSTLAGVSSNRCNPFFIVQKGMATESVGECYGFNLVYSGNHYSSAELNPYGKLRILNGINPEGFEWLLQSGESLQSPEAIMTYSPHGFRGISIIMHDFVRHHIVRGVWQWKERPVLFNSWEASYFDINEQKLLKLAKKAKDLGIELFVLDDGWFGKRDDDTSSLGDWQENRKKLPSGIKGLSKKITEMGLDFGIWVEPEMVNVDSECYRNHPNWAVQIPEKDHSEGRYQRILDLTNPEVQNFVISSMQNVFSLGNISYVKWDMNRVFSDSYSQYLQPEDQGSFFHRYVLGLYRVFNTLVTEFPEILFESCASGGNRFDLGVLCYMPQIWASDNSDAISRLGIQEGYSYGYPLSVMGAHVSGAPNHQTLRRTPTETRYHVACYGLLGYECNLLDFNKERLDEITKEIEQYKKWRTVYQFGKFYRIPHHRAKSWMVVSHDQKKAVLSVFQTLVKANNPDLRVFGTGLKENSMYRFYNIPSQINVKVFGDLINTQSPIHIKDGTLIQDIVAKFVKLNGETEEFQLSGGQIMKGGVAVKQAFIGMGFNDQVRHFQDFAARTYYIEEVEG